MLPTRLPIPLPGGSSEARVGDVRPIAQWVEPPRSGAGLPVTTVALGLTIYGFRYLATEATDTLTSLWMRREAGPTSVAAYGAVYVNGASAGGVTIVPGDTEETVALGVGLSPGDTVEVYVSGTNSTVLSGVLRTPSRLFRLSPSALGRVWILSGGEWVAPPEQDARKSGAWTPPTGTYAMRSGAWTKIL